MTKKSVVGVCGLNGLLRLGVQALAHRFALLQLDAVPEGTWPHVDVLLFSDRDRRRLKRALQASPEWPIVVLLESGSNGDCRDLFRSGAAAALSFDVSGEELARTVEDALAGVCRVPIEIVQSLVNGNDREASCTPVEITVLSLLGAGLTVRAVADQIGYSERETFRILQRAFGRLGVQNRAQAIAKASRMGLIDPDDR